MKTLRYLLTLMLCSAGTSLAQSEAFQAMMTEAFLPLSSMISDVQEKVGKLKCGAPDLKMGDGPENAEVILNQLARSKGWSLLTKAEVVGGTGYLYQTKTKTQFVFASISVSGYIAYESCDASGLKKPQVTPAKPPSAPAKLLPPQVLDAKPQPQTVRTPPPPGVLYDPTYYANREFKDSSIERRLLELAKLAKRQNIFPRFGNANGYGNVNVDSEHAGKPCDLSNLQIIGRAVGAFTQPLTKQFAFLYGACETGSRSGFPYSSVGLVIMQQNRVVHHSIFAYTYSITLQTVLDLNNDGLDELMLLNDFSDQQTDRETRTAFILNANAPTLRTLYAFDVIKNGCTGSTRPTRETLIKVKRGKRPVFTGDIYINDCYQNRKLIARNQVLKPTGQVLRIYGKGPLKP